VNGWNSYIQRSRSEDRIVRGYAMFERITGLHVEDWHSLYLGDDRGEGNHRDSDMQSRDNDHREIGDPVMRLHSTLVAVAVIFFAVAYQPGPGLAADRDELEQRATALEHQIAVLQRELAQVRDELAKFEPARAMTPAEAVAAFLADPKQSVTVEFGVAPIGERSGPVRVGDDPDPPIVAVWDNFLVDGGTLEAVVPPAVYKKLALPGKTTRDRRLQSATHAAKS
jgi:hypothetical protein